MGTNVSLTLKISHICKKNSIFLLQTQWVFWKEISKIWKEFKIVFKITIFPIHGSSR